MSLYANHVAQSDMSSLWPAKTNQPIRIMEAHEQEDRTSLY